jgi:DNA (cytosine-5)-methyltransferase 1
LNNSSKPEIQATKQPIALSFFSGAMGCDLGIEKAGFEILLACEFDKTCQQTIKGNKPNLTLLEDINSYTAEQIMQSIGMKLGDDVDLIIGGPPCQAFSTAGKRQGFKDARGNAFLTFIDLALEIRPKYFVIENVRGLMSCPSVHRPHEERGEGFPKLSLEESSGGALMYIFSRLNDAGYGVTFNLYNAANFGSPQVRERIVIVCSRDGKKLPFLTPTHSENGEYGLPKWNTLRNAISDLDAKAGHFIKFSEKRLKYYRLLSSGQYWKHLPENLQKEALGNSYYSGGGKTGFFRRLDWDKPSPTLVTHPAMPATDLAHPDELRPLSVEEYKRIQEFPDDWYIAGDILDQYKQIGNAVPISLGYAIGKQIRSALAGTVQNPIKGFKYSRYRDTDDGNWVNNYLIQAKKN